MIKQDIIDKYHLEEIEGLNGAKAYRVKNKYVIKAYLADDLDWYADNFLNACYFNRSKEDRLVLARTFIRGFIAEEFVMDYLKDKNINQNLVDDYFQGYFAKLTWQDQKSRYSYSQFAIENRTLTKPDYFIKLDALDPEPFTWYNHTRTWADCKYCSNGVLTTSQAQRSHGASHIIALCKTDTDYVIRFYNYFSWDDCSLSSADYNKVKVYHQNKKKEWKLTGYFLEMSSIAVSEEFNTFLEKYKNIR